ncbi:peptidyl-tRNA hydrolase [Marasmius fiardii PR-910]|nr:peptidyl-tRNA hydrolase [Marasmius fiardii PR-910]
MHSQPPQVLVVGLGNLPLPGTRHSLGQHVLDALASRLEIRMSSERKGISGTDLVIIGETPVQLTLFKSKSAMNISGPSVAEAFRNSAIKHTKGLIVLQDSMSHRSEIVSARLGGSANGHNGIKSIVAALGGKQDFYRFRLGIGERGGTDAAVYVMGKLSSHERQFWQDEGLDQILEEIEKVAIVVSNSNHG